MRSGQLAHLTGVSSWVGPPQAEEGVEQQAGEEDRGQARAKLCLFGVRVHCGAAQGAPHLPLGFGENGHYDQGDAGQNDSRNAVFGSPTGPQVQKRFIGDVGRQQQKANADNPQGPPLIQFAVLHFGVNRHPPQ